MKFLHAVVTLILVLFFVSMVAMRLTYGSFAVAGAVMDRWMGVTADEVGTAAEDVAEKTDEVARDIADGPDGEN